MIHTQCYTVVEYGLHALSRKLDGAFFIASIIFQYYQSIHIKEDSFVTIKNMGNGPNTYKMSVVEN